MLSRARRARTAQWTAKRRRSLRRSTRRPQTTRDGSLDARVGDARDPRSFKTEQPEKASGWRLPSAHRNHILQNLALKATLGRSIFLASSQMHLRKAVPKKPTRYVEPSTLADRPSIRTVGALPPQRHITVGNYHYRIHGSLISRQTHGRLSRVDRKTVNKI